MTGDSNWKEASNKMSELHHSMNCNRHINKCSFMLALTSSQQLNFWTEIAQQPIKNLGHINYIGI